VDEEDLLFRGVFVRHFLILFYLLMTAVPIHAGRSSIVESEGSACGVGTSEAEASARIEAQRQAKLVASTVAGQRRELADLYLGAPTSTLQELNRECHDEPGRGSCCTVRLKVEVMPEANLLDNLVQKLCGDGPSCPLGVRVWTDKQEYREGEKIKISLSGNKPFFAKVVYTDAGGNLTQLLPNPFRKDAAFDGGAVAVIPDKSDKFELEVDQPFGLEQITLYAGTVPPGELGVIPQKSGVYSVTTVSSDVPTLTRRLKPSSTDKGPKSAEFAEATVKVTTRPKE
jgi:Domain of unknown function (DUF4384)